MTEVLLVYLFQVCSGEVRNSLLQLFNMTRERLSVDGAGIVFVGF